MPRRIARIAGSGLVRDAGAWRVGLPLFAAFARDARQFAPFPLAAADSDYAPGRAAHTFWVRRGRGGFRQRRRHTQSTHVEQRPRLWPSSSRPLVRWLVAHPLSPRPLFGRRKRVPMSRGPSAVQAGSVANGSPARLRACRARSLSSRCPRLYGFGFALYLTLTRSRAFRLCISPPPPGAPRGSVTKPRTALQTPIGEAHAGMPCACSRLTGARFEVPACGLVVKSAVRLVRFARFNSVALRPPAPSIFSRSDRGTDQTSGRTRVRAI